MPLHRYSHRKPDSDSCDHVEEILYRSMSEEIPPEIECDECGKILLKEFGGGNFVLKGSGWYKDHYGLKS